MAVPARSILAILFVLTLSATTSFGAPPEIPRPEGMIRKIGTARFRAAGQVHEIGVSPGGDLLIAQNVGGEVRIWDIASGRLVTQHRQFSR